MKRRDLLKAISILGASAAVAPVLTKKGWINPAHADISPRVLRNARAIVNDQINFVPPTQLPTVINVFMYGGPSELAGNLMNIEEITGPVGSKGKSQNDYKAMRGDITQPFTATGNTGQVTPHFLWKNAGGLIMEDLIPQDKQMTLYRTINRVQSDTKAHRESIFTAQTGGVQTMDQPGMGTVLAAVLRAKLPDQYDNASKAPILPFVTFEGDTVFYDLGDLSIPLPLRAVSLSSNLDNPYARARTFNTASSLGALTCGGGDCEKIIEDLAKQGLSDRFAKVSEAFNQRGGLDTLFKQTFSNLTGRMPAADLNAVPFTNTAAATSFLDGTTPITQGTNNFSNGFGTTLRSACLLALVNKDTKFITLSTGGLGGWDDHDNSITKYEQRITNMMSDLRNAVRLLRTGTATGGVLDNNARNDVVINVFGEFGRNVNLNGSMGWDHGNNMNLYTFGGSGITGRRLGEVVGTTAITGSGDQNRLFTTPASGSETFQPYAIAATVYRYFGVKNPEVLTSDPTATDAAKNGYGSIDGPA